MFTSGTAREHLETLIDFAKRGALKPRVASTLEAVSKALRERERRDSNPRPPA
jgi:hypothetical protein